MKPREAPRLIIPDEVHSIAEPLLVPLRARVRGRRPGVVIDLEEHPDYERIVLTTRHGLALVQALRLDVEGPAEDVADLVS